MARLNPAIRPQRDQTQQVRNLSTVVPAKTGKSKRKGRGKAKKGDSGKLDRVDREQLGALALHLLEEHEEKAPLEIEEFPEGHEIDEACFTDAPFGEMPKPEHVRQGTLRDTWALATLAAVAQVRPELLVQALQPIEESVYRIALGDDAVMVTSSFVLEGYADPRPGGRSDLLWAALFEKALAVDFAGSYALLEGGNPARLFERLIGGRARRTSVRLHDSRAVLPRIESALAERRPVVLATRDGDAPWPLVSDHYYAVLKVDGEQVELYDVAGDPTPFSVDASELFFHVAYVYEGGTP